MPKHHLTDTEKAFQRLQQAMNALSSLGADDLADQVHAVRKELSRRVYGEVTV